MKRVIINIFTTTGLALVILSAISIALTMFYIPFSHTVLQILGANVVIHLGLFLIRKFESRYIFLEVLLEIAYIMVVLVVFHLVFDWFYRWLSPLAEIGILVSMAVIIYMVTMFLRMGRIREDVNEINKLLEKRNKKT
ncbi:MAG: hypothetical protein FWC89_01395 [Defluviitaleaceae bacterium]|nr:hypothetical protein [Defluviitaleaceae bacterium]